MATDVFEDIITQAYPGLIGGFAKPLLKLRHGWVIEVKQITVHVVIYRCLYYEGNLWLYYTDFGINH